MFLRLYKHLLARGRAWRLVIDKTLRQYFVGLSEWPQDFKDYMGQVWRDIFAQDTTDLETYEDQFALPNTDLTEQERRDRLEAAWKAQGGQSPRYIQDTLQNAGFPVFIHEWWEPPGTPPPTARNPFDYLNDGVHQFDVTMAMGHDTAFMGGDIAYMGAQIKPSGYPLVNKVDISLTAPIAMGNNDMFMGGDAGFMNSGEVTIVRKVYEIPNDPTKWPYFLYLGGEVFPELASIPASRRDEFEDLCLKICPTQQWLGILVEYT